MENGFKGINFNTPEKRNSCCRFKNNHLRAGFSPKPGSRNRRRARGGKNLRCGWRHLADHGHAGTSRDHRPWDHYAGRRLLRSPWDAPPSAPRHAAVEWRFFAEGLLLRTLFAGWRLPLRAACSATRLWSTRACAVLIRAIAARATWTLRGPHLLQLLQLLGRQDLLDLCLHLRLQVRHLLLLVCGQVQLLQCTRGQHVESTLPWSTFATLRTLPRGGWTGILCSEEAR